MTGLFNLPVASEYEQTKDIQELLDSYRKLNRFINDNWNSLPEEEKRELIHFYYKVVNQEISFLEKARTGISVLFFIVKYGFQPFFEYVSIIRDTLNTISAKIEQENENYQKDLQKSLSQDFEVIGNIDEFIRKLDSSTK